MSKCLLKFKDEMSTFFFGVGWITTFVIAFVLHCVHGRDFFVGLNNASLDCQRVKNCVKWNSSAIVSNRIQWNVGGVNNKQSFAFCLLTGTAVQKLRWWLVCWASCLVLIDPQRWDATWHHATKLGSCSVACNFNCNCLVAMPGQSGNCTSQLLASTS